MSNKVTPEPVAETKVPVGAQFPSPSPSQIPPAYNPSQQQGQGPYYPPQGQMQFVKPVWTKHPQPATCQFCHKSVQTATTEETGTGAWLLAGGLCLIGCCCVAWLPFTGSSCKDVRHSCQNCGMIIGEKRFLDI